MPPGKKTKTGSEVLGALSGTKTFRNRQSSLGKKKIDAGYRRKLITRKLVLVCGSPPHGHVTDARDLAFEKDRIKKIEQRYKEKRLRNANERSSSRCCGTARPLDPHDSTYIVAVLRA